MEWEVVVGLEIHTQLATESKIFSGSATRYGAPANAQANLIDLGYPGVLPVLNQQAVKMAVKFGLATHCEIAERSVFARKNYFYPDLPKGYQISQYELPIVHGGHIDIVLEDGSLKTIGITRAHLEEDAGKSLHEDFRGLSGIDLNRAGTPLLEIVSEPDMRSASEAGAYMRKIHTPGALSGDLRRQHAGGLFPVRRQRVGETEGRERARYTRGIEELELVSFCRESHRVGGGAADRCARRRW